MPRMIDDELIGNILDLLPSDSEWATEIAVKIRCAPSVDLLDLGKVEEKKEWHWVCTECGAAEYTSSVSEGDIEKYCGCSSCGSSEFHREEIGTGKVL